MSEERLRKLETKIKKGGPLPSSWPDTTVLDLINRIRELERALALTTNTLESVLGWLESFGMPPSSSLNEKREHMELIEHALGKVARGER